MPMFQSHPENVTARVIRRTSLEELADLLIAELAADIRAHADAHGGDDAPSGLFYAPEVIAPNKAMRRYLTMRFARNEGIAAGIRFPSLMSLFPADRIDAGSIGWRIYRILEPGSGRAAFPSLERWIRGDSKRCHDLAVQLGRLYYQYMLYRPDWLNAWERNAVPDELRGVKDADWQGELWRRTAGSDWKGHHFASEYARVIRGETGGRRRKIRLFGFSQPAPAVMECLAWLSASEGADVALYQPVPSRGKYFDETNLSCKAELKELVHLCGREEEDPGRLEYLMSNLFFQHNPLIASFGMQSRVAMTEAETLEFRGADDEEGPVESGDDGRDTILHRLQRKIRADEPGSAFPAKPLAGQDGACPSVQIRSCYSAFREVEAAHNFILHCIDEEPSLSLNDIFIMTPKPEAFAPLVDAVFNHSEGGLLPVSIADRPRTDELQSYRTFLDILSLFKGEFTASEVLGILQDASIQTHLGVSVDDCREFRDAVMRAGIRWGWDAGEHGNESSGGRAFPQNSWEAGFDRMLLHYAMDLDPAAPFPAENSGRSADGEAGEGAGNGTEVGENGGGRDDQMLFAVPGYSGSRALTLGKIALLIRRMHDLARTMRARSATGVPFRVWKDTLIRAAEDFFGAGSELSLLLTDVLSSWGDVLSRAQECPDAEAGPEESGGTTGWETDDTPLNSETVLAHLGKQDPDEGDSTRGFLRGSITFCGLRPMRSIPAGVIVLLGMDHRSFPGEADAPEFDLMQKKKRVGDPDRREESRQLFLDVILAAREYLYISYVGRDNHDRKEYPPSVCVDVLRSYLEREFGKNSFVDIQEPLQAFSPALFTPGCRNQSYSRNLLEAARKIRSERTQEPVPLFALSAIPQPPDESLMTLSPDDLLRFLRNPAEAFLRNRLDASVSVYGETPPEDSEPFGEETNFDANEELFELYLRTPSARREGLKRLSLARLKADGIVPLTQTPESWGTWDKISSVGAFFEAETAGAERIPIPQMEKTFACGATLLLPEENVFASGDGTRLQIIPALSGKLSADLTLRGILKHLGANLRGKTVTRILLMERRQLKRFDADAVSPEEAEAALDRILNLYCEGMRRPLPFFPRTLYEMFRGGDYESAWNGSGILPGEVGKFGKFFGVELPPPGELEPLMGAVFGNDACLFRERSAAK